MTAERAQLAANLVCIVALFVAVVSGAASLLISRGMDRAKDRLVIDLLQDVRDHLLFMRPSPAPPTDRAVVAHAHRAQSPPPARPSLPRATQPAQTMALPPRPSLPPRGLPAEERVRMLKILSLSPGPIVVTASGRDSEADAFADLLAGLFREAGWKVERSLFVSTKGPLPPLSANLGREPRDLAIAAAFADAGYGLPPYEAAAPGQVREILVGPQASGQGAARLAALAGPQGLADAWIGSPGKVAVPR